MGCNQTVQPLLGKVCIRPTMMVVAATSSTQARTTPQNTPQAHAHPTVDCGQAATQAVFEISKPAHQRAVHVGDDDRQAVTVVPSRLAADRVVQLVPALLPRPVFAAAAEVIAPALQLVVLPARGLTGQSMGRDQTIQAL